MGITKNDCKLLFYAKSIGVSFERSLMLGRLQRYVNFEDIEVFIQKFNPTGKKLAEVNFKDDYTEPLFELLGASSIQSMDFSDYEQANIIHDLNNPIPDTHKQKFSLVLDSGTIEHIFNFPTAIKNAMEMVEKDGHFIGIAPANNVMGHGFYQFSPELYYRVFSPENGFKIVKMFVSTESDEANWYEVADPITVRSRILLTNSVSTFLLFIAQRTEIKEIFSTNPQQSDYACSWAVHDSVQNNVVLQQDSKLKFIYRKIVPKRLKTILRNLRDLSTKEKVDTKDLGTIDPNHFKKVEL